MKPKDTICIAWCHGGTVDNEFAISLMEIVQRRPQVKSYHAVYGTGLLAKSRNILVNHFLDNTDDDWLLMLDADEKISLSAFDKLTTTAHHYERPVVAGVYFAAVWNDGDLRPVPLIFHLQDGGVNPWDDYPKDTVVQVMAAGTGCLLMHRSALLKFRSSLTDTSNQSWCWFQDGPIDNNRWLSEDLTFCSRLGQLGIPMFAHTGAVLEHHKDLWITEKLYDSWLANNKPGEGLEKLQ